MGEHLRSEHMVKQAIARELYAAFEKLGARSDLLGIIGSYGDTLSDQRVFERLHRWNTEEP